MVGCCLRLCSPGLQLSRHQHEQLLRALVDRAVPGARIYFARRRPYRVGFSWNGRHLRPTGLTLENQLHEIAHVLVAPAERHPLPEFGLGSDPYRRNFAPRTVSQQEADAEEMDTCRMQLLLARLLGLDEAAVIDEFPIPPLSPAVVRDLWERRRWALPEAWWQRAFASVDSSHPGDDTPDDD